MAGSMWRVVFEGADWWRGIADRHPMGGEHVAEEKKLIKIL
jgi:hypothetical protein